MWKILNSDWFAIALVVSSGILLSLLYFRHRTTEAIIGCVILAVATVLIILGRGRTPEA